MPRWKELSAYLQFTDEDAVLLRGLSPLVEPHLSEIAHHFYGEIDRHPKARAVFENVAQVERLKITLQRWLRELLTGPYDAAYWTQRERIGRVHVRIGLADHFVFGAMSLLRQDLFAIIARMPEAARERTRLAVLRITEMELAVMTSTYREEHEAEELRSLHALIISNLPVAVLCLDADGRVTASTRTAERLFSTSRIPPDRYEQYFPADLLEAADLQTRIGRSLATKRSVVIPRISVGAGRDERIFRITVVPLDHPLARVLVHLEELTDAIGAESRLRQAEALARIGRLSAHMAHEIRNPLAAISATLQVISGTLPPEDRRVAILTKVQEQVLRLDRLVSDLLGYSRPVTPKSTRVSLEELAREGALAAGVQAQVLVAEGSDVVSADPQIVQQILVNLLQNARDAAGPTGRIEVRVGPGPELRVCDDGPGVAPDQVDQIFEPFVTTKIRGTGLGLAISRKYAEAMGGSLCLLNERPLGGAALQLRLPKATEPEG